MNTIQHFGVKGMRWRIKGGIDNPDPNFNADQFVKGILERIRLKKMYAEERRKQLELQKKNEKKSRSKKRGSGGKGRKKEKKRRGSRVGDKESMQKIDPIKKVNEENMIDKKTSSDLKNHLRDRLKKSIRHSSNTIQHFGVKGMRWGVRRARAKYDLRLKRNTLKGYLKKKARSKISEYKNIYGSFYTNLKYKDDNHLKSKLIRLNKEQELKKLGKWRPLDHNLSIRAKRAYLNRFNLSNDQLQNYINRFKLEKDVRRVSRWHYSQDKDFIKRVQKLAKKVKKTTG